MQARVKWWIFARSARFPGQGAEWMPLDLPFGEIIKILGVEKIRIKTITITGRERPCQLA
jgi:hypothetical protein